MKTNIEKFFLICKIKQKWSATRQKDRIIEQIKQKVKNKKVYVRYLVVLIVVL